MKILITGSSGVLGSNLVRYFIKRGYNDLVLFDITKSDQPAAKGVPFIQGDIRDKEQIKKAVKNADIIIHSAATSPSYDRDTIFSTIIGGTEALLEEGLKNNIQRFVYISSTSVYGVPKKSPVMEGDETPFYDPYNESKIKAEAICRTYREKGLCVPILRPRSFIGPGRLGTFSILFQWAKDRKHFPMVGKGANRYQLLDVEDLCQAVFLAATAEEDNANHTFNIGAKEFTTLKEDYQAVLDEAGYGKKIISFPAGPMMAVLSLLYHLKLSPLYKRLFRKLNLDYYVSIEKAEKLLGYKPEFSNKESLARNFRWYMDNYGEIASRFGNDNSAQWNQGIFKLAKVFF